MVPGPAGGGLGLVWHGSAVAWVGRWGMGCPGREVTADGSGSCWLILGPVLEAVGSLS